MRNTTCCVAAVLAVGCNAQQVPDTAYRYRAALPAYAEGEGPWVVLDEAHRNFHTLEGRYAAFGRILADDGYRVRPGTEPFSLQGLEQVRILAIANALPPDGDWDLPTETAFTPEEIAAVERWVRAGGSLFVIADHMPFGGAAAEFAAAFGFNWINGYALRDDERAEIFRRSDGSLSELSLTNGAVPYERIDSVATFTGSAFLAPPAAQPILHLSAPYSIQLPVQAGTFTDRTARIDGRHFLSGALLEHGLGRVVCFAEAAMFSAQRRGPERLPMGLNQPEAAQNAQFLLNVVHWLDHRL